MALTVKDLSPTALVLTDVMGFRKADEHTENGYRIATFAVGPGGPGAEVRIIERPDLPFRRLVGAGNVHHVAFRVPNDEEQEAWQQRLTQVGIRSTPVIDRYYFKSVYFREPGGVLFELATDGPGFTVDEDEEHLGEALSLPPFLEPRRERIQAGLSPLARAVGPGTVEV